MEYKYEKVKKDIQDKIENGEFKPGDRVYSEDEIKKKHMVSSTTAVKALQELVTEGYLIRRQGEGTFVRKNYKHQRVFFDEELPVLQKLKRNKTQEVQEKSEIISIEIVKDSRVAKKLKLNSREDIVLFCRKGTLNETPWTLSYSYIAFSHLKEIENIEELHINSLSDFLEKQLGVRVYDAPMTQSYSILPLLDEKEANLLKTPKETPVFYSERINYYPDNKPFQYTETYIHHRYYRLQISTEIPEE
ncbi:GntR family transcriptional regulator [Jeotgalibaca sp. MA1X17-3]|uniref:GntR family transcriptional regulator n=1 Tax=Jeotgalibaca sp. MA1X17-3 TaxID=2908211 RepID=UPI001F1DA5A8|nr:GntR family transcriptional regulator [Jeotgalibaca sp. MA1X17-3]UJF15889.1 GntR family transcriptional regulator [Jeotgalibaca sp. MA1X17-3]